MLLMLFLLLGSVHDVHAQALRAEGPYFRDAQGGVVVLRGLNVAGDAKVPPFRVVDDARLLDDFPAWGVNVARVLFTWEAFEPVRGEYDAGYLDYYVGLLDALHARGVWAIVDLHQDAFSRFATDGCGEGMPEWAVSPATTKHEPDNGPACSSWGIKFIIDTDTHRCWDDFYADTHGVRTRYLALLDTLAERLSDHPAVIGYDVLNEPWADEKKQLGPLYADAARVVRAHAESAILFVSPRALTSAGQDTELERPAFDNFAYAPHFYDGGIVTLHRWLGSDLEEPVGRMQARAEAWNVPLFVGEFGAPAGAENGPAYMEAYYAALDARFASGAQWSFVAHWTEERKDGWNDENFSIVDAQLRPRDNYRVRPYPARIAGKPSSFVDRTQSAGEIELAYEHDPGLGATRIFAPGLALLGSQLRADIEGPVSCAVERDRRHVRCTGDEPGAVRVVLRACDDPSACLPSVPDTASEPDAGQGAPGSANAPDGSMQGQDGPGAAAPKRASAGCSLARLGDDPRGGLLLFAPWLVLFAVRRATSAACRRARSGRWP